MARPIDSTSLLLKSHGKDWGTFSAAVCGAKAPIVHDPDAGRSLYRAVTPARIIDIAAAHEIVQTGDIPDACSETCLTLLGIAVRSTSHALDVSVDHGKPS